MIKNKGSNITFQYINFFNVIFRQGAVKKKKLLALSTDTKLSEVTQGNFDIECSFKQICIRS